MAKKICRHCGIEFELEPCANARKYCYDPSCVEKEYQRINEYRKEKKKTYQINKPKKIKKPKKVNTWPYHCQRCGAQLKEPRRINCIRCASFYEYHYASTSPEYITQ